MIYRRLPLNGATNARDLGGYPCKGGATRFGKLLRADGLHRLTPSDVVFLYGYGVRTVIDLRDEVEIRHMPDALHENASIRHVHAPMVNDAASTSGVFPSLGHMYLAIAHDTPEILAGCAAKAIEALSEGAVLFHCSAGKDRTGILAALLLETLGVAREDIIADYQITRTYIQPMLDRLSANEVPEPFRRSDPELILMFLRYIEEQGGARAFLLRNGVSESLIEMLGKNCIEYTETNK